MIILTDLSDVLVEGVGGAAKLITKRYGKLVGIACILRLKATEENFKELLRGKISEEEYFTKFLSKGKWSFGPKEIRQAFSDAFKMSVPGTLDVYRNINAFPQKIGDKKKIFGRPKICIVSDHIKECVKEIANYHPEIFEIMTDQYWSYELGMLKRDEAFFQKLLSTIIGVPPDEVIFIDDKKENVIKANHAGIKSIQFVSAPQLKLELQTCGFEFSN